MEAQGTMYMRVRAYVCVCARARVCVWAHTPKRTHALTCVLDEVMTTYAYIPHVSAIELLSIGVDRNVVRLAGVWLGDDLQREHRRVEHRGRVEHALGKCRSGRALDAACLCVYVCLRAYVPHVSAIEPLSIGVDRVWSGWQASD
jgi:hypothetical protein